MKADKKCHIDDVPADPRAGVEALSFDVPIWAILKHPNHPKEFYVFDASMGEWEETLRLRGEIAARMYLGSHAKGPERHQQLKICWEKSLQLAALQIDRQLRQNDQQKIQAMLNAVEDAHLMNMGGGKGVH